MKIFAMKKIANSLPRNVYYLVAFSYDTKTVR